jgi:hypothetical protein
MFERTLMRVMFIENADVSYEFLDADLSMFVRMLT